MNLQKVSFTNSEGYELFGRLELPVDQSPHNFALLAHCFTCTKNIPAVKNISRALISKGFGVLRFDFTGLGESEGEFADSNFSANVEDLLSAATFLEENYQAPSLIVGHSLGGAAALYAVSEITSIRAVATIGTPSTPAHLQKLLRSELEEIRESGKARVMLGGREFTIKRQFLEDLEKNSMEVVASGMSVPYLILHSPQDAIVSIGNAEALYVAARHPKSFVSLDGADHMLSARADSLYTGRVIAEWAWRYLEIPAQTQLQTEHQVIASLSDEDSFTTQMKVGDHYMVADEPLAAGGANFGPSPYELLAAGLSSCTAMTLQLYAKRKKWPLQTVNVHTSYNKIHAEDCKDCEKGGSKIDTFRRSISLTGKLDDKQTARLLEIADKCPVHRTLEASSRIITSLEPKLSKADMSK